MCLGIPGQVVAISNAENKLALVEIAGIRREVNLACIVDEDHRVEDCVGDWVLVHVGFAMSRIDEAQAAETLRDPDPAGRSPGRNGRHARFGQILMDVKLETGR